MAEPQVIRPSYYGRITYDRNRSHCGDDYFRSRRQRPHILRVANALDDFIAAKPKSKPAKSKKTAAVEKRPGLKRVRKFIGGSDPAKRLVRLVTSTPPSQEPPTSISLSRDPSSQGTTPEPSRKHSFADPGSVSPLSEVTPALHTMPQTASPRASISGQGGIQPRPLPVENIRHDSIASTTSVYSTGESSMMDNVKPVASGNGVSVFVTMAEPVIYLSGFENSDPSSRSTAMLRGNLLLRVTKSAKIKTVSMKLRGRAETEWPEGIPPKRAEFKDVYNVIDHTFSFYDCNMGNSEHHGAHTYIAAKAPGGPTDSDVTAVAHGFEQFRKSGVFESITSAREGRRMSLQSNHIKSIGKAADAGPNPAHKGYRTFTPGDYFYNFELPIDSRYPETIDVELGKVKYELEATVERAGAFRTNLIGSKEVQLVRAPSGDSLEAVEPIAISRDWEDQLHYDIVISGKSFPLGSQVPIAFKLTPLAKVQCHRVKVFITENIQYFTKDKKVHRMEPTRKLQLFEKRADSPSTSAFPGSQIKIISGGGVSYDDRERAARGEENVNRDQTNLLGGLDDEFNVGPTEMELNVQLPSCWNMPEKDRNQRIHFDTTYSNIQVHHWIKIVMRLSKSDPENEGKRRHFEISIDSPLNILSCRSTQANTALPSYEARNTTSLPSGQPTCGCPGAPTLNFAPNRRRNASGSSLAAPGILGGTPPQQSPTASSLNLSEGSIAPPPAAHIAGTPAHSDMPAPADFTESLPETRDPYDQERDRNRPIHLLRQPSFNPPAFDDHDPPPPLVTPPPQYETQFGSGEDESGLADYFQRLADEIDESDDGRQWANRLEIPLTPGGRVNRSMDEVRTWNRQGVPSGALAPAARRR